MDEPICLDMNQRAEVIELEVLMEPEELASRLVYYRDKARKLELAIDMAIEYLTKIPGDHEIVIQKLRQAKY